MSFKMNGEEKNNISNYGEHSTWFNTKSVIQENNENSSMKESSLNLNSPIMMQRLDKRARKLPEAAIGENTFRLNQGRSKRRKMDHFREELFQNNFILPENNTMSVAVLCKYKLRPGNYKTSLITPKLNPRTILNLMKRPSVTKLMKIVDLMYTESLYFYKYIMETRDYDKYKLASRQLRKYLFKLCYQKFCELWLYKKSSLAMSIDKKHDRLISLILRYSKNAPTISNRKIKKLLIHKGKLMTYLRISHLTLCVNIICIFFTNLLKKSARMYHKMRKKREYLNNLINEKHSIKLYVEGTTKRKGFLDIVKEYKLKRNINKLSFIEVSNIKHAYENHLEPGQHITEEDLDICADENYRFKINQNISSNEKNDDFVFEDIESIEENAEIDFLYSQHVAKIDNTLKCQYTLHEYVHGIQFNNNAGFKNYMKNESMEKIETESHIQSTSNEERNIDMDISTDDFDKTIATNYSGAETSSENLKQSSNNYSKISERFNYKLLSRPITLTKSEKRMLSTIILAVVNQYNVKWKWQKPSERTRLFQIIVYFGSLKMGLSDKPHLDRLDLKGQNICDMIDIEKLLKSIKIETCMLQECFTFTEGENFLTWPLGKMIVNNIISQRSPTINILFSLVKNIITKFCKKAKDFCRKSGLRIVLNKEFLFESLSNVRIGKDVLNTELLLKYANVHTYPSPVNNDEFLDDVPGTTSNTEYFCVTNTGFCIKKNSSNEEICKSMVNILKSDDSIHQSWKECNNSLMFISNLLKAGITLPIKVSNTGHGSKFAELYVRWFYEEYLQDDKFYKLATSILKNIFLYIDLASGCTDIKIEDAINNAFIILYDQPCFAKAYESYLNTKYSKCTNDTENYSDYKGVNIRAIEELQIEPNVDVQTDPIDTNDVDMPLVPSNIPTSNEFDILNDVTIKNLVTPDLQSANYDIDSDFLLQNLINENSDNLMENIDVIYDSNNIFDNPDTAMIDIDYPYYNNIPGFNQFNEDSPFDDAIPTTVTSYNFNLSNGILGSNLEFQQTKNTEDIDQVPINSFDQFINFGVKEEEINLQLKQAKDMEEVSMISSDQLVNFDQNDEINLHELGALDNNLYGFYNAGVLLPP